MTGNRRANLCRLVVIRLIRFRFCERSLPLGPFRAEVLSQKPA
jgi:hypothetical protein